MPIVVLSVPGFVKITGLVGADDKHTVPAPAPKHVRASAVGCVSVISMSRSMRIKVVRAVQRICLLAARSGEQDRADVEDAHLEAPGPADGRTAGGKRYCGRLSRLGGKDDDHTG